MPARLFPLVLVFMAAFSAPAEAQDINALLAEYTKGTAELGKVEQRAEELVQEHKRDEGRLQDHERSRDRVVQDIEVIQRNLEDNARQQTAYANQIVDNWNSQCSADLVGPLEPNAYNRCASLRTGAVQESERIHEGVRRQQEETRRTVIEPLIEIIRREESAMQELIVQSQRRQAEFDKLKEAAEHIVAQLTQIESQFSQDCTTGVSDKQIELMSFCASLGFDRAMNNPGTFSNVPIPEMPDR